MIYRLVLTQGAVMTACKHPLGFVGIESMAPPKYKNSKAKGRVKHRKPYTVTDVREPYCCPDHDQPIPYESVYTLPRSVKLPCLGLLSANRQIRHEAEPIFYGENEFSFREVEAVRPFLKDRTSSARRSIRRISLSFELVYADPFHIVKQNVWIRAFTYLAVHLNLATLSVAVFDMNEKFLAPVKFQGRKRRWLQALTQIKDLDEFDFTLRFSGEEFYYDDLIRDIIDEDDLDDEMERIPSIQDD
ncbi:MAG: hypothetical protein Q9219_000717 [cf. Caloplaca sp. 3 TL-2023]